MDTGNDVPTTVASRIVSTFKSMFGFEIVLMFYERPVTLLNVLRDLEWSTAIMIWLNMFSMICVFVPMVEHEHLALASFVGLSFMLTTTFSMHRYVRICSGRNRLDRLRAERIDDYKSLLASALSIKPEALHSAQNVEH